MKHLIIILGFCSIFAHQLVGQTTEQPEVDIPSTFLIGEHAEHYADLSDQYPGILLSVYNNDMEHAFEKWASLLIEMEQFADEIEYDIKGVKLWFHIYFNADGTIAHISFFPKPNSRNLPNAELNAFFKEFVKTYKLQVKTEEGFQHTASASFPTFFSHIYPETAKK